MIDEQSYMYGDVFEITEAANIKDGAFTMFLAEGVEEDGIVQAFYVLDLNKEYIFID